MNRTSIEGLNVVGVTRQSDFSDGSLSTDEQADRMRLECERQGATLVAVYTEKDVSGTRPLIRRPGLSQAVLDVEESRADVVMTAYFDRMVRSLKTQAELLERVEAKNGMVMTLDLGQVTNGTAAQWLSSTMIGAVSEYYARSVGERNADSKQRALDRGVPPFPHITAAYQRREDGTLEPHEVNAPLIREAIEMRLGKPTASWTTIARWLTEHGLRMRPDGVQAMFASKLMIGELHFGKFRPNLNAIKQPIMSRSTYRRLQSTRAIQGIYSKSPQLLARLGVLVCGTCGARMVVDSAKRGAQSKVYGYYKCGRWDCERPATVPCQVANETVRDEAIRLSAAVVGRASELDELEAARLEREQAEATLEEAIQTLAGLGAEKATKAVLDELQAGRDRAVDRHERLRASSASGLTVSTVADWERLSFDAQRGIIQAVVARAVVSPGRGPDRIAFGGE